MSLSVRLAFVAIILAMVAGVVQLRSRNQTLEQQQASKGVAQ